MNPFFSVTFSKCGSFLVDEQSTDGFCIHVQIWKFALEFWLTKASS